MPGPLHGIRVIDWTVWQQGPVAAAMLGDLGAEVIHVEHPMEGDPARGITRISGLLNSIQGCRNFYFEANNRNKKGITLNLNHPKGREAMYRMVECSDVFVQNMRPGVAERLGMDFETLRGHNPKLIYAQASGYGPDGPDRLLPSLDIAVQGRSGFMFTMDKEDSPPRALKGGICDQVGGIMLAYGVLSALLARERYGVGQQVDTSLLGSMVFLQGLIVSSALLLDAEMPPLVRKSPANPLYSWYMCQDSEWLCISAIWAKSWEPFCLAIDRPDLADDPRFDSLEKRVESEADLRRTLTDIFAAKTRAEWLALLRSAGIIHSPVLRSAEVVRDEQVLANGYVQDFDHPVFGQIRMLGIPVKLSETPATLRSAAPEFGEHTEEVLVESCGFSWAEVAALREEGVI